ncbi:nitroreductase family protein [Burkholderia sp. WSM2230]|uniref:nitroreductase family protein n=1 Tax=Burkholderia sp. WSM2230 TaxID=944435 RepID=UPI0003FD6F66|nr:nitroreductase family protein [Burkholderia sp. WSM2230]
MTSHIPELAALDRLTSGRSTCRAYQHEALDLELIRDIVGMAGRSASWCNVQPWQLVITETPESTERFRQALMQRVNEHPENESDLPFPPSYEGIYRERRRGAGIALYSALGIGPTDTERSAEQAFRNFRMFDAPHVAIVTVPAELGPYALVDAGGFVSSFLIAAYAHGVATTPQGALARHARFVREYFGIPDTQHMICGISFGYAEDAHPVNRFRTTRARVDDLVRFA